MGTSLTTTEQDTLTDNISQDTLTVNMAGASEAELREAFKLFDIDGDGVITIDELASLVSKVGGDMSNADATALIKAADKDGNMGIDFSEFAKLWEALHGEAEAEIRAGFAKLDVDKADLLQKMKWWPQFLQGSPVTSWRRLRRLWTRWMLTKMEKCLIQSSC